MRKESALALLTPFLFLCLSCASTQEVKRPPSFRVAEVTLSKGVDERSPVALPENPAVIFTTEDPQVVAFLSLKNLWGTHTLKWDWFDPRGTLYYSTGDFPIRPAEGKYMKEAAVWHKLTIRGDKAGKMIGQWTLNVYVDREIAAVRTFAITNAPRPAPRGR